MTDPDRLDWERDGHDWPNRAFSRFVEAGGLTWHVQVTGNGPVLLLLHGTGASTHSWRDLMPLLAEDFTVVAPDLPGHGFTQVPARRGLSLPGMGEGVTALLAALDVRPDLVAGHSAGAAVMIRMAIEGSITPRGLVGLNAALLPIGGVAGQMFSPLAKVISQGTFVSRLFARRASDPAVVERLIRQTGSTLDEAGLRLYGRLASNPVHAGAALSMMAEWDLWTFERLLPSLTIPLTLIVGGQDRTIVPDDAFRIKDRLPGTTIDYLRGLGHLAHEERPALVADLIRRHAGAWGVVRPEA